MFQNHKIVSIIPARGGSKGVPRKNIRNLAGKPLIAYTIEQSLQSRLIDRTIVSTEDGEIAEVAQQYGAEVPFLRPTELAGDHAPTMEVLLHAVNLLEKQEQYNFDILVLLHITTPLRNVQDIYSCVSMLVEAKADNVFSVTESHRNPYFNMVETGDDGIATLVKKGNFPTRQAAPKVYDMNASIYVWWKDILKKEKKIFLKKSHVYVMPKERSIDIDDELDFKIAEFLCMNR